MRNRTAGILLGMLLLGAACMPHSGMKTSCEAVHNQFIGEQTAAEVQQVETKETQEQGLAQVDLESTKGVAGYADMEIVITEKTAKSVEKKEDVSKLLVPDGMSINVRKSPKKSSAIIAKMFRECSGQIVKEKSGWYQIKSGSVTGWVDEDYVLVGEEAQKALDKLSPKTVTVKAQTAKLLEKKSESANVLATLKKGKSFCVVGAKSGNWYKIHYTEDVEGYIQAKDVKVKNQAGTALTMKELESHEQEIADRAQDRMLAGEDYDPPIYDVPVYDAPAYSTDIETRDAMAVDVSTETLLAALCQHEAGTNYDGCLAVANVVLNRVRSASYPNTIEGVIYQKSQFENVNNGALNRFLPNPNSICVQAARAALAGTNNVGSRMSFRAEWAAGIYENAVNIGGNVFY